jgi:hypothetical protein
MNPMPTPNTARKVSTLQALVTADAVTFRESVRGRTKFYQYSIPLTNVAAGTLANPGTPTAAAGQPRINIEASSHFFASEITGVALVTATLLTYAFSAQIAPRIQLTDEGTGAAMFDQPIAWPNVVGDAQHPFRLQPPYLMRSKSNIRVDLFNPAGVAVTLQLTFGGTKVFLL